MDNPQSLRRTSWSFVFAWVSLIYGTLYFVRPVCTFLQNTTPFALLVNILMYALLAILLIGLLVRGNMNRPWPLLLLLGIGGAYVYGLSIVPNPEEKLHFIEYGILAYLIFRAVEPDVRRPLAFLYAFLLTTAFGWMDEGIQHLLPNRYYQNADVLLNAAGGLLGLAVVYLLGNGQAKAGLK